MADDTLSSFERKVQRVQSEFEGERMKRKMNKVGVAAKKAAERAASADLGGDPKFSGWAPKLDTRYDHVRDGVISFHPSRRSAGPWTVAEFGRNQMAGPRPTQRLTKTGRVSKAKTKRWNGRTQPKHTATDALRIIDKETTKIVSAEVLTGLRQFFDVRG